jgi:adenosylcobinamide amidohydrolase
MDVTVESRDEGGAAWPVLVWRFGDAARTCSTGPHGGGLGLRSWAFNAQVPAGYAEPDPDAHAARIAAALGLTPSGGVGLLTAAPVARFVQAADDGVEVVATVGLGQPEWAAAPAVASLPATRTAGTINVLVWIPEPLADAALVNAVATITEAKAQALFDEGVAGTGTATDAVVVACPAGDVGHAYGGPRSRWGAPLARAAHDAIARGARAWLA